ncbi:MAG: DsbA family protein [Nanoarchaeota archaeon]|nr:DsbA family protein [Nanoarchaeota archaeon]
MVESMNEVTKESGTITIKKDSLWKYSTLLLVAVVLIGGFIFLRGNGSPTGNAIGGDEQPSINARALIEDNDPVLGDPNAGISIIEFSDFQCPYCKRAFEGAIADFKNSDYFTSGQVNLIYKHFPLSGHQNAQGAAEASLCAQAQGKFWEMHDLIFQNSQGDGTGLAISDLKQYASQLGLNTAEFNTCLDDGTFTSEVRKELAQGTSVGISGTPGFVIVNTETGDATSISGAYPWSQFEAAISSVQ